MDADSPSKRRTSSGTRRDARSLALPITAALLIVASVFVDAGSLLVVLRPAGFGPGGALRRRP
jgi:hypothetical protein